MGGGILEALQYYLAEQPVIVGFRWSNSQTWGSTWSFLFASIILYLLAALAVHLLFFIVAHALLMLRGRRLIRVGVLVALFGRRRISTIRASRFSPLISFLALLIPALHSLLMAVVSVAIFLGLLFSSAAEIRDTRWLWGRSKTPLQWLFCFPLGTRPTGRVFFWSYLFYLSRFLQLPRALLSLFMFQRRRRRRRRLRLELYYHLFHYPVAIFISFLWLEFSQSFQVVAILCTTLLDSLLYGCRFRVQGAALLGNIYNMPAVTTSSTTCYFCCFPTCIIINIYCRMVFLVCNLLCHLAVLLLHFSKGGCNGIRVWAVNSILHAASLLLFIKCYVNKLRLTGLPRGRDDDDSNNSVTTTTTPSSGCCSQTSKITLRASDIYRGADVRRKLAS